MSFVMMMIIYYIVKCTNKKLTYIILYLLIISYNIEYEIV